MGFGEYLASMEDSIQANKQNSDHHLQSNLPLTPFSASSLNSALNHFTSLGVVTASAHLLPALAFIGQLASMVLPSLSAWHEVDSLQNYKTGKLFMFLGPAFINNLPSK